MQNIRQGQHAAVRAGFQRLLQRNGACFAPGVAQLHPQLVFNAAAGVTGKAGGAGTEGMKRLRLLGQQAHPNQGWRVVLLYIRLKFQQTGQQLQTTRSL